MIVSNVEQLSQEWFAEKAGLPSASSFGKILTPTGLPSKSKVDLMYRLAGEKILESKVETYQSAAMANGVIMEETARTVYEIKNNVEVTQIGLAYFDERKDRGCSPDGLIESSGGLEIKCPEIHTHVRYLLDGKLPTNYIPQIQGSLYVTGLEWWDFMSYYPGLNPLIIRVERDEAYIMKLDVQLNIFVLELNETVERLKAL